MARNPGRKSVTFTTPQCEEEPPVEEDSDGSSTNMESELGEPMSASASAIPSGLSSPQLGGTAGDAKPTAAKLRRTVAAAAKKMIISKRIEALKPTGDVDLNTLFDSRINRKSPEMMQFFWKELKVRLIRRYGTLEKAYHTVDSSGDGSINLAEFVALLKSLQINLNPRFCRTLFDKASGNDKALAYDEFLNALMASTLEKMTKHMKQIEANTRKVHNHANAFIRRLVFASEENKGAACDRFQRKFTKKVLNLFLTRCRKYTTHTRRREIDVATFVQTMLGCRSFLQYEEQFLAVVHSNVDRGKCGSANITDLVTTMVLLSDWSKKEQLQFLFKMFDFDGDECLTSDQILVLYVSLLIHRPIVLQDKAVNEANSLFNDELAMQEGRRLFHLTMDSLDLADGSRSLLNFEELYGVYVRYPFVLDSLLPGMNQCRWVLNAVGDPTKTIAAQLPPVSGHSEASAFRRDISKSFLSIMREEPTEIVESEENWTDVHRTTFQSWAEKAFQHERPTFVEEAPKLGHSQSAPAIALSRQNSGTSTLARAMKGTRTLPKLPVLNEEELPEIGHHRFGKESVPRFLMYSTARSSWLRHCTSKHTDTIPYRCPVCSTDTQSDYHDICIASEGW